MNATWINYCGNIKNRFFDGKLAIEQIQASTDLFSVPEIKIETIWWIMKQAPALIVQRIEFRAHGNFEIRFIYFSFLGDIL